MPIYHGAARVLLDEIFAEAEQDLLLNRIPEIDPHLIRAFASIFDSGTQAYREVLVGCTIARLQDPTIDVRLPYIQHGPRAFNGRTLDERVVNPFFHGKRIPSSKGLYLSTFRRSVSFVEATKSGLRDREY